MKKIFPKLKSPVVLAPMHNITNAAFRLLCKEYGASMVSTELLSANALVRENKSVLNMALFSEDEKPISAQMFGQKIENVVNGSLKLEKLGFNVIDFNCGCPSAKIMGQGSGGALMNRPKKISEIVKALAETVKIPVSVKIRSGINGKENAVEIAKICEKNGASAITVHARTVEQGYLGRADWRVIKKVKEAVTIPVIGNGDVWNGEEAKRMIDETSCDYVMIGRGAIGNPFVFKEIREFLKSGKILKQSKEEKIKDYFKYIQLCEKFRIFSLTDAKLKAQDFTKGLRGSNKLRRELNKVKSFEEIEELMKGLGK